VGAILDVFNSFVALGLIEAGPTTVGVELGVRFEQEGIAASAVIAASAAFFQ
jgi:hypothetical protein